MSRRVRMLLASAMTALGLGLAAGPAAAGIWTEIPSGTSATITAVEYQSDTRFWYATSNGEIWRRRADLSGFDKVYGPSSVPFNDLEFQAGGEIGLAVGDAGTVLRSTNGGGSWAAVTSIPASNVGDGSGNKCTINTPLSNVHFVRFAGNGRVWIGGDGRQLATSQPAVAANVGAPGQWKDANRKVPPVALDNCWISSQNEGFADMFVTPNPDVFYLATGYFGEVVYTTNNLTGTPQTKPEGAANGFTLGGSMAGDPGNPDRLWSVSGAPYGNSTAQYTENAFQTYNWFNVVNEASHPFPNFGAYDVDFAGGTILSAGNAGYILNSTNGRDFYWNGADGALATQDWRAAGLASATQGAVGGVGGKLVVTSAANSVPVAAPPPTTPAPPTALPPTRSARLPVSFTGKGNSLGAKIVGRRVRVRARGTIRPPAGASVRSACTGKLKLTVKRKRTTLATRSARLKVKNGACRFGKTIFIKRAKVGRRTTRLRLKISFKGNPVLAAGQTTKTLVLKR